VAGAYANKYRYSTCKKTLAESQATRRESRRRARMHSRSEARDVASWSRVKALRTTKSACREMLGPAGRRRRRTGAAQSAMRITQLGCPELCRRQAQLPPLKLACRTCEPLAARLDHRCSPQCTAHGATCSVAVGICNFYYLPTSERVTRAKISRTSAISHPRRSKPCAWGVASSRCLA